MDSTVATRQIREYLGRARIFGATFTKADGTQRTGSFRLGVSIGVTGEGQQYDPDKAGNIIAWDMRRAKWVTIKLERVQRIRAFGKEVNV